MVDVPYRFDMDLVQAHASGEGKRTLNGLSTPGKQSLSMASTRPVRRVVNLAISPNNRRAQRR